MLCSCCWSCLAHTGKSDWAPLLEVVFPQTIVLQLSYGRGQAAVAAPQRLQRDASIGFTLALYPQKALRSFLELCSNYEISNLTADAINVLTRYVYCRGTMQDAHFISNSVTGPYSL